MTGKGFKQTEIGLIPKDWEVINLNENFTLKARIGWQGLTTSEYLQTGDYFLVTGTDFRNGFINWDKCVFVEKFRYDQDPNIQLKINDVLITKDGTIGKIAYINKLIKKATLNSGVFVLRTRNTYIDSQFIYYVFMSFYFDKFLNKISAGSTITHLYQKDFINFNFILPSLSEQKAIAEVLSDTDAWIESLEKQIEKKRLIKQGAMQKLLTPKEDWEIAKLGNIAKTTRGASPRPIDSPIWFSEKTSIGWVRISDVTKSDKYLKSTAQSLSELGVKNSRFVERNSLIMSICATIGKPIITKINVCIHDGFVMFSDLQINQDYLYNFLKYIEKEWARNGQTGSQMNLNTTLINNKYITFPKSLSEQTHIATILSEMDIEIEALEKKINKARQIKQGMMQELLTGRIRLIKN